MLGSGTIIGELAMIIDGLPRSASVFAVRDCELSFIGREEFRQCTTASRDLPVLRKRAGSSLRGTDEAVAAVSFLTVKERLARALIELPSRRSR
jgi:CRP/FNR family cyclic AMP-dependent transcriptional regulator